MYKLLIVIISTLMFSACSKQFSNIDENKNELVSNSKFQKYSPILISNKLPSQVNEQSGMLEFDNLFWVINDSYCSAEIM